MFNTVGRNAELYEYIIHYTLLQEQDTASLLTLCLACSLVNSLHQLTIVSKLEIMFPSNGDLELDLAVTSAYISLPTSNMLELSLRSLYFDTRVSKCTTNSRYWNNRENISQADESNKMDEN